MGMRRATISSPESSCAASTTGCRLAQVTCAVLAAAGRHSSRALRRPYRSQRVPLPQASPIRL
eukprot:scaffold12971_cov62-Isochrysis_galbana.AAC.1